MASSVDAQYTTRILSVAMSSGPSSSTSIPRTTALLPRRIGSPLQDGPLVVDRGMKLSKALPDAYGRARSNSKSEKGKEPVRAHSTGDTPSTPLGRDRYIPHYNGNSAYTNGNETGRRPSTSDGNSNARGKFRGSLLVAASDALGLKFGRRKPPVRQPPPPHILSDVIEITAQRADAEDEERNRLREMAAHAIGVDPYMVSSDSRSRSGEPESPTDEEEDEFTSQQHGSDAGEARRLGGYLNGRTSNSESASNIGGRRSPHGSSVSVTIPPHNPKPLQLSTGSRLRVGSMAGTGYSPSSSATNVSIPSFPSTVAALSQFHESSGVFPKYYPPSSLRIFALSKNWKNRYILLSTPSTFVTKIRTPSVSYLHLFKSSGAEEKELERLEINEDSVVFVSEEDVGGKRHVIKVGGADVGAMRKEYTHEEGGHVMWLLQISDQTVAQQWITNIKHAILGQRTVRAGLIPPLSLGNNEPRGDMDVMMSVIRAQGTTASPTTATFKQAAAPPQVDTSGAVKNLNYASSISSHSARSQSPAPKPPGSPTSAVSALKGLFSTTVGRPRSGSRATSINSERHGDKDEESFTRMGSNLLNMMRASTPDTQSINTVQSSRTTTTLPFATAVPTPPLERRIDRRILTNPQEVASWTSVSPEMANASSSKDTLKANKGFLLGAMSLQPPPRKRWTSSGLIESTHRRREEMEPDPSKGDSSRRVSFTASRTSTDRMSTDRQTPAESLVGFQFGTPEQRPRAPSLQSVSTLGSADNGIGMDRSSLNTKRSSGTRSARRWSRQGILPNRLTPPSDPPPAVPTLDHARSVHPYAATEQSGAGSTHDSVQSSEKSIVSNLPKFAKRASGSSQRSVNSISTTYSHPASVTSLHPPRASSTHRNSMPPPRPAPTSALPPAPVDNAAQDTLKPLEESPVSSSKSSSFRNSVAHRTFRLSMTAPMKPPPSTTLPPRPDEPEYTRRRSSSGSSNITSSPNATTPQSSKLETIPASPVPPTKTVNPFPPPLGPLPPPPIQPEPSSSYPTPPEQPTSPPRKRSASITIKERLRKLSAPIPSATQPQVRPPPLSRSHTQTSNTFNASGQTLMMNPLTTTSQPATPIAEKITLFQNDPSFLQMHTPVLPSAPNPIATSFYSTEPPDDQLDGIVSLLPPPRRGSKQLLDTELQRPSPAPLNTKLSIVGEPMSNSSTPNGKMFSLSRPGSAMSVHSGRSQNFLEIDWESPKEGSTPADEYPPEKLQSPVEPVHISLSRPGSVVSLGIVTM